MAVQRFPGFPLELLHFLHELASHNNRDWFQENKQRYEDVVREPAMNFIASIADPLQKISEHFRAIPKKVGGSLMRIHRDIRFSKDKSPYKTNVGIHFRHAKGKDVHAPGFYFHIDTDQAFLGAGIWHPDNPALTKIRKQIHKSSDRWKSIVANRTFRSKFEREGDILKRPPKGFDKDHPMLEDLKRKDHIAVAQLVPDQLLKPTIVRDVASTFKSASDYVEFLCKALKLPF